MRKIILLSILAVSVMVGLHYATTPEESEIVEAIQPIYDTSETLTKVEELKTGLDSVLADAESAKRLHIIKETERIEYEERKVAIVSRGGNRSTSYFSTNTGVYTEQDVIELAKILQAECGNITKGDWRREATVIVNRLEHLPVGHAFNPDGTILGVITARDGRQFNGIWLDSYKAGNYTDKAYQAAEEVLLYGYRSFETDIIYFSNVLWALENPDDYDLDFINSIYWKYGQTSNVAHSYGK